MDEWVGDAIQLTRRLIDIPSVSGDEKAVANDVANLLEQRGYRVELVEGAPGRPNVLAAIGAPYVVLSTHLDTVPPFMPSREDDLHVYGRGATDAKGIAAAQIVAADLLLRGGMKNIGLLFVVDEEVNSAGARAANGHPWSAACRYLVNGEPTSNRLAVASKGSLQVDIETTGSGGHSAYPERGRSAVHDLLAVLEDIRRAEWPSHPTYGETTVNIGTISGGSAANVLAERARAQLQFRCAVSTDEVGERLRELVGNRASVTTGSATPPVRLRSHGNLPTCVVAYTTDIPHLSAWGTPFLLGPGSIADAHVPDERIAKAELETGVQRYVHLARSLTSPTRES